MKNLLSLALILLASAGIFAQEPKTIDKPEFDKVYQASFRAIRLRPYRKITTTKFNTGSVNSSDSTSKSTAEFLPSVGYHSIFEGRSRSERIVIGDKVFTRKGSEQWQEGKIEPPPSAASRVTPVESKIDYKFLGNEKLGTQNTSIYETVEQKKFLEPSTSNKSILSENTKYWFAEDGLLLKTESSTKVDTGVAVSNRLTVTTYELDPTIKVEAPNLNSVK